MWVRPIHHVVRVCVKVPAEGRRRLYTIMPFARFFDFQQEYCRRVFQVFRCFGVEVFRCLGVQGSGGSSSRVVPAAGWFQQQGGSSSRVPGVPPQHKAWLVLTWPHSVGLV